MPTLSKAFIHAFGVLGFDIVAIVKRKAYFFRCFADFSVGFSDRFQASKDDCAIVNFHAKDFDKLRRHCGRIQLAFFNFDNYILTSFESRKRRRTEVIDNSDDFHVDVDEFAVPKVNVPNVIFNFDTLFARNQSHTFPSASFVFFGILEQGFLHVLVFQSVQGAIEKVSIRTAVEHLLDRVDDERTRSNIVFAGFRLASSEFDNYCNILLCKFATIVIRLDPSLSKAHWVLSSDDSCPLDFLTIVPGFLIHNSTSLPACESKEDVFVFFPKKLHHVTVVDPDSLKEICIPRYANRLTSAQTHSSVPICKSRIERENLFDLFEDLPFNREAMLVGYIHNFMCYVEPGSGKIWYFFYLLSKPELQSCGSCKTFKRQYFQSFTWLCSRLGMLSDCRWSVKESILAALTDKCFILKDVGAIAQKDFNDVLKNFYDGRDGSIQDVKSLVSLVIQKYSSRSEVKRNAAAAQIRPFQRLLPSSLNRAQSRIQIFPTLEFDNNSCWMETSLNCLFAISLVIFRISVHSLHNDSINCLYNLFKTMCFYRCAEFEIVPVIELKRCGIYPCKDDVPPLVLGESGWAIAQFAEPSDKWRWGTSGSISGVTLFILRLLDISFVEISVTQMPDDMSDERAELIIVNYSDSMSQSQNTQQPPDVLHERRLCAVAFANGAHWYSLVKNKDCDTWTLKDALTKTFVTVSTFREAFETALSLYDADEYHYFVANLFYCGPASFPAQNLIA
jgi:hypothetical protein